jgi:hypothetical protein
MKREIKRPALALRVWQDEGWISNYVSDDAIQGSLDTVATARSYTSTRQITVEVAKMPGHPSSYGLLGAEFTPQSNGNLTIEVALSNGSNGGPMLDDSLADGMDSVHSGLPRSYGSAVLEVAMRYAHALGPGTLRFPDAAHGTVGSSQIAFGWLTRVVLELLVRPITSLTDEELWALVLATWHDTLADYKARRET